MIRKVLIANRGEIAIRICHTLREMGIKTGVVYTQPDEASLHVQHADEAHEIGSYLDSQEIVRIARNSSCDAIHPGYGFLSENPVLASTCEEAGVTFIGPRSETIRAMADKLESKRLMRGADVPVVPTWDRDPPPNEYPVLVKAVGGGGGKGMRLVHRPGELAEAQISASREAAKAFDDDRIFVEKYVAAPRHIEFQILGDAQGNYVHLFERECSIQRRHQKIVEETPSPSVSPALRAQMAEAALTAARTLKYLGAGTIEFIVDPTDRFYFLEMNTRLQVEHPVTEVTTGVDLVREQVIIASGNPLSFNQAELKQVGHAIECRIYAESPEENFRPAAGLIRIFRLPEGPGIRLDSGVTEGSVVSHHYDPMLAKLIASGQTRRAAIDRMQKALKEFVVLGVTTNIEFLRRVMSDDDFVDGKFNTHFIDTHPELFSMDANVPDEVFIAVSLAARLQHTYRDHAQHPRGSLLDAWNSGKWRNS